MNITNFNFEHLILPISSTSFLENYWERQPLIIYRKKINYYSSIFSMNDIDSLINRSNFKYPDIELIKNGEPLFQIRTDDKLDINKIYNAYHYGNTLIIRDLQDYWHSVAIFHRNLELFLNHPVSINMILTPKNTQGLAPHIDPEDVFILQVEGCKIWRIYDSVLDLPLVERNQPVPKKFDRLLHEVSLQSGDLLYIPRGYAHEARTSENSSLHLTVAIDVFRWNDLIADALLTATEQHLPLRKALPVGFLSQNDEVLGEHLIRLLEFLVSNVKVEDAIGRIRKRFIKAMVPLPNGHFVSLDTLDQVDLDTLLSKREGTICSILNRGESVVIQFPGNSVTAPSYTAPALHFIVNSNTFLVSAIPDLTNESKLVLARRLIREGLLTIVDKTKNLSN